MLVRMPSSTLPINALLEEALNEPDIGTTGPVSYTHLTLPTNREV